MSRPLYETKANLDEELQVMQAFAKRYGYSFKKIPIQYRMDFAVFRDKKMLGLVEVRCRTFSWNKYSTLIMSMAKLMHMQTYSNMNIPVTLLLKNADGLWWWKYNPSGIEYFGWGGRFIGGNAKPRDDQDEEPVGHIHRNEFREVDLSP